MTVFFFSTGVSLVSEVALDDVIIDDGLWIFIVLGRDELESNLLALFVVDGRGRFLLLMSLGGVLWLSEDSDDSAPESLPRRTRILRNSFCVSSNSSCKVRNLFSEARL